VGLEIEAGNFVPDKEIHHTHEGSIGNLCNREVAALMDEVIGGFGFADTIAAEQKLIKG